jgi:D-sedoheptulose 7-phosphate isomerase
MAKLRPSRLDYKPGGPHTPCHRLPELCLLAIGCRLLSSGLRSLSITENPTRTIFWESYLSEAKHVIDQIDQIALERLVDELGGLRARKGRLFILGVGGSAGNASHAVNDFRKIVGIEAYAPTDNVSELTARTNDEGWTTVFEAWLRVSHLSDRDALLIFSVGGGNREKGVSPNLVSALEYAKEIGARVLGIVGRDGGYTAKVADACFIVPTVNPEHVTPHSEAFQSVIWHGLVSHPKLKQQETKWESVR